MAKFLGDVRPLSADPRYMGVVFSGTLDDALAQAKAKAERDHGNGPLPRPRGMSRDRALLLMHLNLLDGVRVGLDAGTL
jgi:hypothetical protein